jgi:hypothetical protein
MKVAYEFIITIMLLTNTGKMITIETNNISCQSWFDQNVQAKEYVWKIGREKRTYHQYQDQIIVGYVCSNNLPQ